jgi:hypothetical protein
MKGKNNEWAYEIRITGTVRNDAGGQFIDEFAWSDFVSDGVPRALTPEEQAMRVQVTLAGGRPFVMPNLAKAGPIVGPVTDLLTFYADLFLAMHVGVLVRSGDHIKVPSPAIGSWAAGPILIGEDAVDFDITLTDIDTDRGVARLLIKHVPPAAPGIRLVAEWMRQPVADTANNWVQVVRTATGYEASVGKETFDVELTIDLSDGTIISGTMTNPVTAMMRTCRNEALTQCGDPRPDNTLRVIEMTRERD